MKLHDLSLCLHLWWENKRVFRQVLFAAFYFFRILSDLCVISMVLFIYVALVQAHHKCSKLPHSFKSQQLPRANCFIKHVNSVYKEWSWVTRWCQVLGASESGVTYHIPWRGHLANFTVQMNYMHVRFVSQVYLCLKTMNKKNVMNVFSDDRNIESHNKTRSWFTCIHTFIYIYI